MGEVLARGAPRALGFDLSSRVGEQDLLPFTKLLTDRRDWKTAARDQAQRSFGAAAGMGVSVLNGVSKISDGDVMAGMVEMLPVGLRNLTKGYQLTTDGYVDAKGNKLPITPGGSAILYQLLGLTSSDRAEYTEKAGDVAQRQISLGRQAGVLRNHIVDAVISGDATLPDMVRKAQKFDQDNPAYAVLPGIEGALSRKVSAQTNAQALGTPLGLRPTDLRGRELVNY